MLCRSQGWTLEQDAAMLSRSRDPRNLFAFFDSGYTAPRTPALARSAPALRRAATHCQPLPDDKNPFSRRSRTRRLPTFEGDEAFYTRATPPRLPALEEPELDEEYFPSALSEADFTFIAGPAGPGRLRPERWKTRLTV